MTTTEAVAASIPPVMGVAEIARAIGLSKSGMKNAQKARNFPVPLAVLDCGTIWDTNAVRRWALENGRSWTEQFVTTDD